ncbi:MAG: hypothetical protein CBB97_03975 [Candidatus Endolissoclinum sp. TMED37]|nr:MAG: hypothetical protein CBB97_03975 [Candidatus Endolissoclinum sp. TMED37]|tara:strand:+ start:833 stop:1507 length:675 start_codon:yes stop_codon:yes gene_type:complete
MKKILVLAPHADDEVIGCGGTINKYSNLGSDVYVSILTNASIGAPELFSKNILKNIRNEAITANKDLKVKKLLFEEFPAPSLDQYPIYKIANYILKIINKIKPDSVFIPSESDIHVDHKIINHAAMVSLRPINKHIVKRVLSYETLSETHWSDESKNLFTPNFYEKLNKKDINIKKKSFLKYKSQVKYFPHPRSIKGIETLANFRGMQIASEYAEAFEIKKYIN